VIEKKIRVNCSSLANDSRSINSSLAENVTLANNSNNTAGQNYSVEANNITLANNSSGNITLSNNTAGQNSSLEGNNITLANNISGNITLLNNTNSSVEAISIDMANFTVNTTPNDTCLKTKYIPRKAFVKLFTISYSDNGDDWKEYHEGGEVKEFEGNTDPSIVEVRRLNNQLITRYIRIYPKAYKFLNCIRVEIYGCKECLDDLGAGTGEIPNNAMTASSYLDPGYQPWLGRLYNPHGAWCSATNDGTQYLQVQFSQVREIRQLRTQGSLSEKAWVKTYFIEHSEDGEKWTNYTRLGQVEVMGEYIEKKVSVGLQNSDLAWLRKA